MMPTTFELVSEGRKLADELGCKLYGILLGDDVDGLAKELGGYGADGVYMYNSPLLKNYTTDGYTKVIRRNLCPTRHALPIGRSAKTFRSQSMVYPHDRRRQQAAERNQTYQHRNNSTNKKKTR